MSSWQQVQALTGCPELTAKYYCDLAGGSADQAVVLYFDSGGAPPPVVNKAPRFELPSGALPELTDKGLHEILKVLGTALKIPPASTQVYKKECTFGFDTPDCVEGIFLNLTSFQSFGKSFLELDQKRTGNRLYLNIKKIRVPKPDKASSGVEPIKKPPTTVAEALKKQVEKDYEVVEKFSLVVMPQGTAVPFPYSGIPDQLFQCVQSVIKATDEQKKEVINAVDENIRESKYAKNLQQEKGVKVNPDPSSWECESSGLKENLWLNLSDGYIGSSRSYFDGTGGKDGAINHYHKMKAEGKEYPLVVKLGTITKDGADLYSYAADENCSVTDPFLAQHLANIGINIMTLKKTSKTTSELELDYNLGFDWSSVVEAGEKQPKVRGPGCVGLKNIGNSCYLNSVIQTLLHIPEIRAPFADADTVFKQSPASPHLDLRTQMAKLTRGLFSKDVGRYMEGDDVECFRVTPTAFKSFIGKGQNHRAFAGGAQQDAMEFWDHVMAVFDKEQRKFGPGESPSNLFAFSEETRLECAESKRVRYSTTPAAHWALPVPVDCAINKAEVAAYEAKLAAATATAPTAATGSTAESNGEPQQKKKKPDADVVHPIVPFTKCMEAWAAQSSFEWKSPALDGRKGIALQSRRFATFPKYLLLRINRFYTDEKWTPQKLNAKVKVPLELNISEFAARGRQAGEEELDPSATAPKPILPSEEIVTALAPLGFSENARKRAAVQTKNAGTDAAMNWILSHLDDADLNAPLETENPASSTNSKRAPDEADIALLLSLGFKREHAIKALANTAQDPDRAATWLLSHADELDDAKSESSTSTQPKSVDPGTGKYRLVAMITHMGRNSASGHYICHIETSGHWVRFNDETVTKCKAEPPVDDGYMYVFEQVHFSK